MRIVSEQPISSAELKAEIERIKTRDKELNFRGTKTEEYLQTFVQLDEKKAKELRKKLEELNVPRLKDTHIIKIMDLMPATPEDVKLILQGYTLTVNQDNLKRIAKVCQDFIHPGVS